MPATPFHLECSRGNGVIGCAAAAAMRAVAWAAGLQACASIYAQLHTPSDEPFDARVLRALHITPQCDPAGLLAVPSSGPLVVAANHPHGVLDGLLLASLIRSVRPDVRILANHLLARIPELSDLCFYADPFGGASAGRRSLAGLRAAQRWLVCGGSLIVFPSGEVAHRRRPDGWYTDSSWHSTAGRIVIASGARVVPAFIAGSNRRRFYAAGRVHPRLRTMLLAHELLAKRGQRVSVRMGPLLSAHDWSDSGKDGITVTQRIRETVEELGAAMGARTLSSCPDRT